MAITGTAGTKALDKDYPYVEGVIAETTKQTTDPILREQGSEYV
jgi:hypothetical protein